MACLLGVSTISQQNVCIILAKVQYWACFVEGGGGATDGEAVADCEATRPWKWHTLPESASPRPLTRVKNTQNRLLTRILFT